jgi:hypothetical protein
MTEQYNFKSICDLTTNTLGLPKGSLSLKSRKKNLHIGRCVAAMIGRKEEEIHHENIGKVLNRSRCVVYHYEYVHDANIKTYPMYAEAYNKVYNAYKKSQSDKMVFAEGSQMKDHLLKNGVKETKNNDVLLKVMSGKSSCIIKTTYFDFSNQLKNIKLAMKNYHYTVNII